MPPELKPLLGIVIALAILHAVLKVRARVAERNPSARAATRRGKQPIATGESSAPSEALEALRRAVERRP